MSAAPEKARRQADLVVADLSAAQHLLTVAETKRTEAEAALRGVSDQLRQRQVCRQSASLSVVTGGGSCNATTRTCILQ
jgi:hypothetical protein